MRRGGAQLRVLMTADAVGGVWTYAMSLAQTGMENGVEYVLAVMGPPPRPDQHAQAGAMPNVRLATSAFRLEWMPEPWADVEAAGAWLLDLERRHRPDVVHLNGFCHGSVPFVAPVLVVGHSCCRSWWRAVRGGDAPETWDEYRRRVTAGLAGATAFAAPTADILQEFEREYGPLPPAQVIHNGAAAPHLGPRDKDPVVLAAGRLWDEGKNIPLLCDAAEGLDWPIAVAGERYGPVGRVPRTSGLIRLGRLSQADMGAALDRAAIYAHPALYEPFGLLPLEAALAGCALVLSDIPTLRELWQDAALFAPPRDPAAWAAQLRSLIDDPGRRARAAAAAQRRARRYSLDRFGHAYAGLYRRLAGAGRTAPLTHSGV